MNVIDGGWLQCWIVWIFANDEDLGDVVVFVGAFEEGVEDAETGNGVESGDARDQRQLESQRRLGRQLPDVAVGNARPHQRRRARVRDHYAYRMKGKVNRKWILKNFKNTRVLRRIEVEQICAQLRLGRRGNSRMKSLLIGQIDDR